MYEGLLFFGGAEIANAVRTKVYAEALGLDWFSPCDDCGDLEVMLGAGYMDPQTDTAPWADPARPESYDFAGFYPLEVTGADASTLARLVTERLGNGGIIGAARYRPRDLVVRGVLLGKTQEAVHLGGSWLTAILEGRACGASNPEIGLCGGFDLDYLALCPSGCGCDQPTCDEACLAKWGRHMYEVSLTSGPDVLQGKCLPGGRGYFAEVEFTLTAGNPFHYGNEYSAREYAFAFTYDTVQATFATYDDWLNLNPGPPYDPWSYGQLWNYLWDREQPDPAVDPPAPAPPVPGQIGLPLGVPPLIDPDCPVPPTMPTVPQSDIYCGDLHLGAWSRVTYRMQAQDVPRWTKQVPIVRISDADRPHEDIRIRFTPDGASPDVDYISEFYLTWLPQGAMAELNAPRNTVLMDRNLGFKERAEHLVIMDSRGAPLRWPFIECGGSWIVTVDVPSGDTQSTLNVDLALVSVEP